MRILPALLLLLLVTACCTDCEAPDPTTTAVGSEITEVPTPGPAALESETVEGITPFTRVGKIILAGQPTEAALAVLEQQGVTTVLDLRMPAEDRGFDEPALIEALGMEYIPLGFGGPVPLSDEIFMQTRELLAKFRGQKSGTLLFHCGSSNRVGAVWVASRVLDEGVAWDVALEEAHSAGLRSPQLEVAAREYVLGAGKRALGRYKLEIRETFPKVKGLGVSELATRMKNGQQPLLLDVRQAEEYAISHLDGAQRAANLEEALKVLGDSAQDREVVVYCSIGYRSASIASELQGAGFSHVQNLEGSIFEWANTGHAVVRDGKPVKEVHPYDEEWGKLLNADLWSGLE